MLDRRQTIPVVTTLLFTPDQLDKLRAVSPRLHIEQRTMTREQTITDVLDPNIVILYTVRTRFPLALTPRLRWVQGHFAGVDSTVGTELWHSDIPITTTSGIHAVPIAEHAITQILAFAHRVPNIFAYQARREWAAPWADFVQREIRGQTLAVIGYGSIGREIARLGQALGMRVLATKRTASDPHFDGWRLPGTGDPEGAIPERFYAPSELKALLAEAHYIVVTTPLTPETRGLIGRAEFEAMRPDAFLVNIARGAIIDQAALVEALQTKRIAGAGLDVADPEPLASDSPLWDMENVIVSPHISGYTPHYDEWATDLFAENLRRFLDNEPLLNLVDRTRGY